MNKSELRLVERSTLNIEKLKLSPHSKVIVGVSGGADSMALLYVLHSLQIDALVVHINYGKRGLESDKDQELVEGLAFEWGFECISISLDSNDTQNTNFQSWARVERYRVFRELKEVNNAEAILVAHHRDDQVETILQKLFRGSGVIAWQGMKVWDGEILRPFLEITKIEILDYCAQNSIPFRVDQSNLTSDYARNFLRNSFEPYLNKFFPGWEQNVLALADKGMVAEQAIQSILNEIAGKGSIELEPLLNYPKELRITLLKSYIESYTGITSLTKGQLLELNKLSKLESGKHIKLNSSYTLVKDRTLLIIKNNSSESLVSYQLSKKECVEGVFIKPFKLTIENQVNSEFALRMDNAQVNWPVTVRTWQDGDRFQPLGMIGSQKVSKHLMNLKVPTATKEKALVLCAPDGTIYATFFTDNIASHRIGTISDIVKCTEQTKEYLTINI
tara:strand:+ start:19124 stop:20464 length:1341 start_codon:yes stop_codon:yes gene_type:complete